MAKVRATEKTILCGMFPLIPDSYDIGNYVGQIKSLNDTKNVWSKIENVWKPSECYNFPKTNQSCCKYAVVIEIWLVSLLCKPK